jgi:PAS domain S-box-containing protein
MHYVGMVAVKFVPTATVEGSLRHAVNVSNLSLAGIVLITLVLLTIVFVSSSVDRQLSAQAQQFEDNLEQLRAVFDSMTDGIIVVDFEKGTLEHNRAATKLLGFAGKTSSLQESAVSFELFLPTGEPLSAEDWPTMRASRGDFCTNVELLLRRKNASKLLTTEITTIPIAASGKKGSRVILSIRDVGERLMAEELIRRQKTQLQNVFDNLTEGILLMDMDLNIIQINRAASRLLGITLETSSRESIVKAFEVRSPKGDLIPRDQWGGALASRGEFLENREVRVRRTDTGSEILVQLSTAPVLDSSGKTIQFIFSYRDITKTKEIDEERKRLAAIVDFSEDAIISKDDKGIVTSWNAGATKVFGYTAEEMIGQSITLLLPADRINEEAAILTRIKRGEIVEHFETLRVRKDGHSINVSLTISPIRDVHGNVIGASKIARDITEKTSMQRRLQQSQKMDAIGQLTGGIAHDFNNLLGVVIGNLDLIERRVISDEVALKRVQTAQKASLRGADLTRRLLAFSSNETLSPEPTKLHHLIRNVIEMTNRVIGPEIVIKTELDESIPLLLVDAAGLESALVNLVVNSRDAMPKGGTITISTQLSNLEERYPPVQAGELKAGRYACISVSDTGEGMSKQTLEHVFEPFFTTKPRGKGTGLGLAMVYGFVKQSQGTVRIYSEPDYGTTVTFYLPLGDGTSITEKEVIETELNDDVHATALVVDDEVDLLDVASSYLEDMDCKAYTAINGAEAIERVQQNKDIDLLVTDIIMPGGMNGVELAQKVRQLNPKIKVIYCSGFPAGALAERSMPLVDGPLLHKPYQRDEFCALVRRVMQTEPTGDKETDSRESKETPPGPNA